ncbi:unnamed protein product [Rotaria socialis]|uniref:G-protein coupled receptors family 1 profile domain-containing protein n=1 Tax=Rotaria socialis TaxID=392032 RepID=A0A820EA04_9BILA|nr:unnamed protein product [Rotaria socialis]CAF3400660.1 unnamed protein product [Rotaria socialis]CAF3675129.1 unnamed protein product [Rotaria socialis]CAF4115044.1 unnamed protein product [Rotaria socialis]CAF4243674.1 unnamed protein product [Rotaria socialis]
MGDDLFLCMASCQNTNSTGTLVGNDSYDIECITHCSQLYEKLYEHTAEKYTNIFQKIAIVLITFGLIGKVFNCIIFLRKPLRGTSTGLLLLLKTIFDFVPLLWTFVFDTKFFVKDEQINVSRILCALSRSSEIFVSWSIGFVILACTVRLATIIHLKFLPKPTRLHVFILILIMMFCGLVYNWHVFYYPSLVQNILTDDQNRTFSYCNILFGRQMGYFSYVGFQSTQEFVYNAPIVNFIVSSLIPFTIVASTNLVIIVRVLKNPSSNHLIKMNTMNNGHHKQSLTEFHDAGTVHPSLKVTTNITKKDVSYETTITLTTSCVFLTTNSIASIYVYVKSSHRSSRSRLTEDIKTSNIYLILRMLTLIDTVLEFYIYFLTGKKFREEVYNVIREILQQTPLRKFFKFTLSATNNNDYPNNQRQQKNVLEKNQDRSHLHLIHSTATTTTTMSRDSSYMDIPRRHTVKNFRWYDAEEILDRIESTV